MSKAVATEVIAPVVEAEKKESRAKNIALFLAAPFIGIGMLGWFGSKALLKG